MSNDRHDAIHPLLTDYMLGEADAAMRRQIEEHAATCATCAEELRELQRAFDGIGLAEPPVVPPPALRARVLESMMSDSRPVTPAASTPRTPRTFGVGWLAAAAALALTFAALLGLAVLRNTQLERTLQRADATYDEVMRQLETNNTQADLAVSILTAGDMRRIDLEPGDRRGPVGRAYFSPTKGLLIVADELPEPPSGRVYQVWLIGSRTNGPVSAGLLTQPRSGRGMLIVPSPSADTSGTITVAITDEPAGGGTAPTGAKHLVGAS